MNLIWRFYFGPDHRWRWQRLAFDKTVVAESSTSYEEYEGCLASAGEQGYVSAPPAAHLRRRSSPKAKRTYVRILRRKNQTSASTAITSKGQRRPAT